MSDGRPARPTARSQLLVTLALVISVIGGAIYGELRAADSERAVRDTLGLGMPAVLAASSARSALDGVQELLVATAGTDGRPIPELRHRLTVLDGALDAMPRAPADDPRGAALLDQVQDERAEMDRALTPWFTRPATPAETIRALEAARALDDALSRVVDHAAHDAQRLEGSFEEARKRDRAIDVSLDLVTLLLAAVAAFLAASSLRKLAHEGESARLRASELDEFSGRVAHDILGPLASVNVALELARRSDGMDERTQGMLVRGQTAVMRVRTIVEGLLEFARAGAPQPGVARTEVKPVLEEVVDAVYLEADQAGVRVTLGQVEQVWVPMRAGVLSSLVGNLVRNAIKHMGPATTRRVVVRARSLPDERVARIEVEDTGPGVASEMQERIFEPFQRGEARAPGLGLGLATVRRLAEGHGGRAGVDSERGRGSTFWVELPAV